MYSGHSNEVVKTVQCMDVQMYFLIYLAEARRDCSLLAAASTSCVEMTKSLALTAGLRLTSSGVEKPGSAAAALAAFALFKSHTKSPMPGPQARPDSIPMQRVSMLTVQEKCALRRSKNY